MGYRSGIYSRFHAKYSDSAVFACGNKLRDLS